MAPLEFGSPTTRRGSRGRGIRGPARRFSRRPLRRAAGFTVVEIMTVVGIILVLVGIAAVAYRSLDNSASPKSTKVTLQNLSSMLAEYEAQAGLRGGMAPVAPGLGTPPPSLWEIEAVIADNDPNSNGNVTAGSPGRYAWDAIGNTQRMYATLQRIPANKSAVGRLPSRQIHAQPDSTPLRPKILRFGSGGQTLDPPLVLDAWGNPIIFVGKRGLFGVGFGRTKRPYSGDEKDFERPNRWVTSVRVIDTGFDPKSLPAGARPFFASAGPDGNFRTGDDNVYSFEQ